MPNAVNIKINRFSSNKNIVDENNRIYNEALEKIRFKQKLEYQEQLINNKVTEHCYINNSSGNHNNNSCNDSSNYRLEDCNYNSNSNSINK